MVRSMVSSYVSRGYMYMYIWFIIYIYIYIYIRCATYINVVFILVVGSLI